MSLKTGSQLGPYQIKALLGAGGMGEVYRASDPRLGRDVAIKALGPHALGDAASRARFEREARAVASLNHPHIVAVYDVGENYIVSELVEGTTLKAAGPLPLRRAVEIVAQVAEGLGAAHARGIVHRDIKPENIMIARDGSAKILDFGIAKSTDMAPAVGLQTEPGFVIGTAAYMSPEQVRGGAVDQRTDIFSLGLVLYEMLAGARAFSGETPTDLMSAILREDPPALPATVPPAVDLLLHSCLEKDPDRRFASARDLAVALRALTGSQPTLPADARIPQGRKRPLVAVLLTLLVVLAILGGAAAGRFFGQQPLPTFRQVTFQRGFVSSGRWSNGGRRIVYSARWYEDPMEVFTTDNAAPESRPLGHSGAHLFAVSKRDELAIGTGAVFEGDNFVSATLAVAPLHGGTPRPVLTGVADADWDPAGEDMVVIHRVEAADRVEFPIGTVLYQSSGRLTDLRFSPSGDRIAFSEHPIEGDDRGRVVSIDRAGKNKQVSLEWESIEGVAWSKDGDEIWYAASASGNADTIYAVKPGGKERVVRRFVGGLHLEDVGADGRVLFNRADEVRAEMYVHAPDRPRDRALDWLGSAFPVALSDDGKQLLFTQYGQAGAGNYVTYLWKLGEFAPVRLGAGDAAGLSADGLWALSIVNGPPQRLALLPAGTGTVRALPDNGLIYQRRATWLPDGQRVLLAGNQPGHRVQVWMVTLTGGPPKAISPEGVFLETNGLSPSGEAVVASGSDGHPRVYPVTGGEPRAIPGVGPDDRFVRWRPDGKRILIMNRSGLPVRLFDVDVASGERKLWRELTTAGPTGITEISQMLVDGAGDTIVYAQNRRIRTLYVGEGLR